MTPLNGTTDPSATAKILVVDDEPGIVDAVATALRYEGFDVTEAQNGRDALSQTMEHDPDLIVLDWMLPDIDGIEVGRRLRERGFKTAILFLTAKGGVSSHAALVARRRVAGLRHELYEAHRLIDGLHRRFPDTRPRRGAGPRTECSR